MVGSAPSSDPTMGLLSHYPGDSDRHDDVSAESASTLIALGPGHPASVCSGSWIGDAPGPRTQAVLPAPSPRYRGGRGGGAGRLSGRAGRGCDGLPRRSAPAGPASETWDRGGESQGERQRPRTEPRPAGESLRQVWSRAGPGEMSTFGVKWSDPAAGQREARNHVAGLSGRDR